MRHPHCREIQGINAVEPQLCGSTDGSEILLLLPAIGERVHYWVTHPAAEQQEWAEGTVYAIVEYHGDYLIEIRSFSPQPIYRWLSELKPKDTHVA